MAAEDQAVGCCYLVFHASLVLEEACSTVQREQGIQLLVDLSLTSGRTCPGHNNNGAAASSHQTSAETVTMDEA